MRKLTKASFGSVPAGFQHAMVRALQEEERPVRRKRYGALVIALIVIALACTAVAAISLNRSPRLVATSRAKEALAEQYGLTADLLPLFAEEVGEDESSWRVSYYPTIFKDRIGVYCVDVPKDEGGEPSARWTHDGADRTEVEMAGMNSDVWGADQVAEAFSVKRSYDQKGEEMLRVLGPSEGWTIEQRADLDEMLLDKPYWRREQWLNVLPPEGALEPAEGLAAALGAIEAKYGKSAQDMEEYKQYVQLGLAPAAEHPVYWVTCYDDSSDDTLLRKGTFHVQIDAITGTQLICDWTVEPAYRTLPEGPLDAYEDAVRAYIYSGAFFLIEDDAEREAVTMRIREAGLDAMLGHMDYGTPAEGDMDKAQALAAAADALAEHYGLQPAMVALFEPRMAYARREEEGTWRITYVPKEPERWDGMFTDRLGYYDVELYARSGTVRQISWTNEDVWDETIAYSRSDFGMARAWGAAELTLFLDFLQERETVLAQERQRQAHRQTQRIHRNDEPLYDALMRSAGFDSRAYNAGEPSPDEVDWETAVQIARMALEEECALDEAGWNRLSIGGMYNVQSPDAPQWVFNAYPGGEMEQEWDFVRIDGRSGAVLEVVHGYGGNG